MVAKLSADVADASHYVKTLIAPVTAGINSVTALARQINDNLVEPIVGPIETALRTYQSLKTEYHDDLAQGLRGLVKIPGQIAGALTNVDAVLARSNQQLGQQQEHTAESILAPGMLWSGAIPDTMHIYHDAMTRARSSLPDRDFPPVDIHSPPTVPYLRDLLDSAVDFVLHPGKLRDKEIEQANEVIKIYRSGIKPDGRDFVGIMGAELEKGLAELTPSLSWITRSFFELILAAKGIDVTYAQQEELWRQDLRAETPTELLGIGTLIEAERRGIIDTDARIAQGLKTGLDKSRQQVAWELTTWLIPAEVAIDWHARGLIDADHLARVMGWNNISQADQAPLIDASYELASPREMIDTEARRTYAALDYLPDSLSSEIPADVQAQYAKTRVTQEAAALDWIAHWKIPPVSWWMTAYFRGLRTYSEVRAAAAMENVPGDVLDDLVEVEKETIQQWMLPDIVAAGIVSDAEFQAYGAYIGLDDKSIALLLAWGRSKEKAPVAAAYAELATVTLTTATTLYEAGTVDRTTLIDIYLAHGYSDEAATLAADAADLRLEAAHRKAEVEDLAAKADLGILSRDQAVSEGYKDGFTDREMETLERTIKRKTLAKSKMPSESALLKMEHTGLLTIPQYVGALEVHGYSTFWARLLAAQELGLSLAELEAEL